MTTINVPALFPDGPIFGGTEVRITLETGTARPGYTGATHIVGTSVLYMPRDGSFLSVTLPPNTGLMAGSFYRVEIVDTRYEWMIQVPSVGTFLVGDPAIASTGVANVAYVADRVGLGLATVVLAPVAATETDVINQAIPAGAQVGDRYEFVATGDLRNNSGAAATFLPRVRVGAMMQSLAAYSAAAGTNRRLWRLRGSIVMLDAANIHAEWEWFASGTRAAGVGAASAGQGFAVDNDAVALGGGVTFRFTIEVSAAAGTIDYRMHTWRLTRS